MDQESSAVQLSLTIPRDLVQRLERYGRQEQISPSQTVESILRMAFWLLDKTDRSPRKKLAQKVETDQFAGLASSVMACLRASRRWLATRAQIDEADPNHQVLSPPRAHRLSPLPYRHEAR